MPGRYGLEIRRADGEDARGLAELLTACGRPADASGVAQGLERLGAADSTVLLALEWGPPSGVAVITPIPALDGSAPSAWASLLLVDPQARRRGIGRMLLKAASQAARQAGCGAFQMPIGADDEASRAFCLATGFEPSGAVFIRALRKRS